MTVLVMVIGQLQQGLPSGRLYWPGSRLRQLKRARKHQRCHGDQQGHQPHQAPRPGVGRAMLTGDAIATGLQQYHSVRGQWPHYPHECLCDHACSISFL